MVLKTRPPREKIVLPARDNAAEMRIAKCFVVAMHGANTSLEDQRTLGVLISDVQIEQARPAFRTYMMRVLLPQLEQIVFLHEDFNTIDAIASAEWAKHYAVSLANTLREAHKRHIQS
ncbi:MAG TPA: hypothetical protein VJB82_00615 [Candidatus Peribacterales bacterium]|nr:hypothetical protein [Candidatus Peribacterales bacterium]